MFYKEDLIIFIPEKRRIPNTLGINLGNTYYNLQHTMEPPPGIEETKLSRASLLERYYVR